VPEHVSDEQPFPGRNDGVSVVLRHTVLDSESTVTQVLRSHGLGRLAKTAPRRTIHSKHYANKTPGHQVQVDVKFVQLKDQSGQIVKRFQYTAVDDATRIRALQIYPIHNQVCAI
jgi:hypothetical protein